MTDEEIYQQIEEHSEESKALYERIHEQVETSIVKHAQAKKRRKKFFTGFLSVAAVLVVTLAIVLPIVLQPQEQEIRYSDASELTYETLNYNLKEYYALNDLTLLYLDWYEDSEGIFTARYYEVGKENDTVYLYETITDGNTGCTVEVYVMKRNIVVESIDSKLYEHETINIDNIQTAYILGRERAAARFEYQGYKYYLQINEETTLDFLLETIESMLNN